MNISLLRLLADSILLDLLLKDECNNALIQVKIKAAAKGANAIKVVHMQTTILGSSVTAEALLISQESLDKQKKGATSGSGTGFAISENGLIVTAYHVVKGANTIRVYLSKDSFVSAKVLSGDPVNDLAILQIANWNAPQKLYQLK